MHKVVFTVEARHDLESMHEYIVRKASRRIADAYMRRLRRFCETLGLAPHRGEHRPGVALNQRTIGFEKRVSVIFQVSQEKETVFIIGIRYAGKSLA